MLGRVITKERAEKLDAACTKLLARIEEAGRKLQERASTGSPDVFRDVSGLSEINQIGDDIAILVACACVSPERIARKLEAIAAEIKLPAVCSISRVAIREIRGVDADA